MATQNLQNVSGTPTSRLSEAAEKWQAQQVARATWRRQRVAAESLDERISTLKVEVKQLREELGQLRMIQVGKDVDAYDGIEAALDAFQAAEKVSRRTAARMVATDLRKAFNQAQLDLEKGLELQRTRRREAAAREQRRQQKLENQRLLAEAQELVDVAQLRVAELHKQQSIDMAIAVKSANKAARQRVEARLDEIKVAEAELEVLKEHLNKSNADG